MWQHITNIGLGVLIVLISFAASMSGSISIGFEWLFILVGIVVGGIALWGMADYLGDQPEPTRPGM